MDIDATEDEFPWTAEPRKIIDDYYEYLDDKRARVEQFLVDPFLSVAWPKRPQHPKSLLPHVSGENKRLDGEELNGYLKENCVKPDEVAWPAEPKNGFSNLEEIKRCFQQGYQAINQQHMKIIGFYIKYGQWLIKARAWHELERYSGTWEQWLKMNVGISPAYCRKISTVSGILHSYPRFRTLSLSFTEVYSRREQFGTLLAIEQTAAYWRQQQQG